MYNALVLLPAAYMYVLYGRGTWGGSTYFGPYKYVHSDTAYIAVAGS